MKLWVLAAGGGLIVVCYLFVDRPVAWFMHDHRLLPTKLMWWPSLLSDWLECAVGAAIAAVVAWRIFHRGGPTQTLLFALAVNVVATFAIKSLLKGLFGRTWPESWLGKNESLIGNNVYGFHPFHFAGAYQSFPSGHAAVVFAMISILWLARPQWRWICALVGGALCTALVALNYHFVSDVLAGAMLGSVTGYYATRVFKLRAAQ